ncbi:unnamed protein product [Cochlearia groenlandica]
MGSKGKKQSRRIITTRTRIKNSISTSPPCSSINNDVTLTSSSSGCCTPKSKKSRIPEMLTCPPAPKKLKMAQNIALKKRKRQIAFFANPDIELFFVISLGEQIK